MAVFIGGPNDGTFYWLVAPGLNGDPVCTIPDSFSMPGDADGIISYRLEEVQQCVAEYRYVGPVAKSEIELTKITP